MEGSGVNREPEPTDLMAVGSSRVYNGELGAVEVIIVDDCSNCAYCIVQRENPGLDCYQVYQLVLKGIEQGGAAKVTVPAVNQEPNADKRKGIDAKAAEVHCSSESEPVSRSRSDNCFDEPNLSPRFPANSPLAVPDVDLDQAGVDFIVSDESDYEVSHQEDQPSQPGPGPNNILTTLLVSDSEAGAGMTLESLNNGRTIMEQGNYRNQYVNANPRVDQTPAARCQSRWSSTSSSNAAERLGRQEQKLSQGANAHGSIPIRSTDPRSSLQAVYDQYRSPSPDPIQTQQRPSPRRSQSPANRFNRFPQSPEPDAASPVYCGNPEPFGSDRTVSSLSESSGRHCDPENGSPALLGRVGCEDSGHRCWEPLWSGNEGNGQPISPEEMVRRRRKSLDKVARRRPKSPCEKDMHSSTSPDEVARRRPKTPYDKDRRSSRSPDEKARRRPKAPYEKDRRRSKSSDEVAKRRPKSPYDKDRHTSRSPDEAARRRPKSSYEMDRRSSKSPDEVARRRPESPYEKNSRRSKSPDEVARRRPRSHYENDRRRPRSLYEKDRRRPRSLYEKDRRSSRSPDEVAWRRPESPYETDRCSSESPDEVAKRRRKNTYDKDRRSPKSPDEVAWRSPKTPDEVAGRRPKSPYEKAKPKRKSRFDYSGETEHLEPPTLDMAIFEEVMMNLNPLGKEKTPKFSTEGKPELISSIGSISSHSRTSTPESVGIRTPLTSSQPEPRERSYNPAEGRSSGPRATLQVFEDYDARSDVSSVTGRNIPNETFEALIYEQHMKGRCRTCYDVSHPDRQKCQFEDVRTDPLIQALILALRNEFLEKIFGHDWQTSAQYL